LTVEQIEALLPWNGKVFLDEQKNKSLEPARPTAA
jgi:hypothetical protein